MVKTIPRKQKGKFLELNAKVSPESLETVIDLIREMAEKNPSMVAAVDAFVGEQLGPSKDANYFELNFGVPAKMLKHTSDALDGRAMLLIFKRNE